MFFPSHNVSHGGYQPGAGLHSSGGFDETVLSFVFSALFAPRMFAARPGQKSPTALHDESSSSGDKDTDKDDSINYTTVDWREFMCNTWHLEPTLRSAPLHHTAEMFGVFSAGPRPLL